MGFFDGIQRTKWQEFGCKRLMLSWTVLFKSLRERLEPFRQLDKPVSDGTVAELGVSPWVRLISASSPSWG